MTDVRPIDENSRELRCDCGYTCQGVTVEEQARDGQRHALEIHGIDVPVWRVIAGVRRDHY